jgi:hypothetical protein
MDLLTNYTHHSELQVITALSLIFTLYKLLAHVKSSQPSLDVSWQRLLTVEILNFPPSYPLVRANHAEFNSLNCRVISPQPPLQSSTELPTLNWLVAPVLSFITPRWIQNRKLRSYMVACVFVCAGTCLPSRCSETAVFMRLLHRNGCIRCLLRDLCLAERL